MIDFLPENARDQDLIFIQGLSARIVVQRAVDQPFDRREVKLRHVL